MPDTFTILGELLRRIEDKLAHIVLDAQGSILAWSSQAETLFGWTTEEALGQPIATLLIPLELQAAHLAGLARWRTMAPTTSIAYHRLTAEALHKHGYRIPVCVTVQIILDDTGVRFLGWVMPAPVSTPPLEAPCG